MRECADGAHLEGHLRRPHQGELRQGAGRLCLWQSAEARAANQAPVLGSSGWPDDAERNHMRRDPRSRAAGPGSAGAMNSRRYIVLHAAAAAAFIFLLQRYALSASLESSLLWALTFGGCAAGLAYMQSNR